MIQKEDLVNADLGTQIVLFLEIINQNTLLMNILERASALNYPQWYLGAGCLAQTVWNYYTGRPPLDSIKDIDLVYFDAQDLSKEGELHREREAQTAIGDLPLVLDVKNQARVHLWYEQKFGYAIEPYTSVEMAINSWPTTATSIGIRLLDGSFSIYAPYGLNDLLGMMVRANKTQITKEIYEKKCICWKRIWSDLTIMPW